MLRERSRAVFLATISVIVIEAMIINVEGGDAGQYMGVDFGAAIPLTLLHVALFVLTSIFVSGYIKYYFCSDGIIQWVRIKSRKNMYVKALLQIFRNVMWISMIEVGSYSIISVTMRNCINWKNVFVGLICNLLTSSIFFLSQTILESYFKTEISMYIICAAFISLLLSGDALQDIHIISLCNIANYYYFIRIKQMHISNVALCWVVEAIISVAILMLTLSRAEKLEAI